MNKAQQILILLGEMMSLDQVVNAIKNTDHGDLQDLASLLGWKADQWDMPDDDDDDSWQESDLRGELMGTVKKDPKALAIAQKFYSSDESLLENTSHFMLVIKVGGLKSDDPMSALDSRNGIESELAKSGAKVTGAGMGADFMDISFHFNQKTAKDMVDKVMQKFGLRPEFYTLKEV